MVVILGAVAFFSSSAFGEELKPFTTDGCSSFPEGTIEHASLWADCCIRHDFAYWKGGTYEERLLADETLQQCVAKAGKPKTANLMLAGVRVGGTPYLPTSFRWGYGWPFMRGYKVLTADEKKAVKKQLELLQIMIKSISEDPELNKR